MSALKEIRTLTALVETASTARVMNLSRRCREDDALKPNRRPLFENAALDRAILVKHRLRPHERDWFDNPPTVGTKILIPVDPDDLLCGAHSFLVGQRGCRQIYAETLAFDMDGESDSRDFTVLNALNELPTLDPFLTREHLKRRGVHADDEYFEISTADTARMFAFVKENIVPLVHLCFGSQSNASLAQAERLAQKILSADMDATMDPLRLTLQLEEEQFLESIFCWKGFLYYKWVLNDTVQLAHQIAGEIANVRITDKPTTEEATYILGARARLQGGVRKACQEVRAALDSYDRAFEALTVRADPIAFRDFLVAAPELFFGVGDRLGAVQHITSFWRYRFREGHKGLPAAELFDIFVDFESGLGLNAARQASWR